MDRHDGRVSGSEDVQALLVVVPAHDEGQLLHGCLDSLRMAVGIARRRRPELLVGVTIVLDDCSDESAEVCRQADVDTLEVALRNVGAARAAGTARARRAAERAGVPPGLTWVANTDADSCVPPDWLLDQAGHADGGADVVLGRVEPDPTAGPDVLARWHALHADGRVGVHGAHLGVRLSAYDGVGGWAALAEREDLDLYHRLLAAGARYGEARAVVTTSSRQVGRTTGGFAGFMAALARDGLEA